MSTKIPHISVLNITLCSTQKKAFKRNYFWWFAENYFDMEAKNKYFYQQKNNVSKLKLIDTSSSILCEESLGFSLKTFDNLFLRKENLGAVITNFPSEFLFIRANWIEGDGWIFVSWIISSFSCFLYLQEEKKSQIHISN